MAGLPVHDGFGASSKKGHRGGRHKGRKGKRK